MAENEKQISRLSRTYDEYKKDLINLSKKYYPELADSFNDASVGAWFIDLMSAVGDNLSYHTDRVGQENNVNSMFTDSSIKNFARMNGLKIPGPKASMCEVQLSCTIPLLNQSNISEPDFTLCPTIKRGSIVTSGKYAFEIVEDVDFGNQFNEDGFSNRTYVPKRDNNGNITGYTITKTTVVRGGTTKIFKKVINENEAKPFMEIILPEKDILNVESILLKESSNMTNNPPTSEYFVNSEIFTTSNGVKTYRFFEVDSLVQQELFMTEVNNSNNDSDTDLDKINDIVTAYSGDETIPSFQIYKGKWTPIKQKFITEYTDNGYLKITFGSSNKYDEVPENVTKYGEYIMSNVINNNMLGLIPKANCTMYILYRVGGGEETNIAQGAVNSISFADVEFKRANEISVEYEKYKSDIVNSLKVTNLSIGVGGKDAPSNSELKYLTKYNTSAQDRCVTVKDYQSRVMQMPPKYGCPFRCACIEDNNKILMSLLGIDGNGKLSKNLPQAMIDNIIEYLSHYRTINDYIEINSGKIYNLQITVNVFIDKNYETSTVVKNVINSVKDYFDVNKHELGEDIFLGDLQKTIGMLDGVISIIELEVYSVYGSYENNMYADKSTLPEYIEGNDICNPFSTTSEKGKFRIDMKSIDNVLYGDYNSMYEIKFPNSDIKVKCKLR